MTLNLADVLGVLRAAVGLEREWSGRASGPTARFAGLRTFTLLGLLAGVIGWLWTNGQDGLAAVLLAGSARCGESRRGRWHNRGGRVRRVDGGRDRRDA